MDNKLVLDVRLVHKSGQPDANGRMISDEVLDKAINEYLENCPEGVGIPITYHDEGVSSINDPQSVIGQVVAYDSKTQNCSCEFVNYSRPLVEGWSDVIGLSFRGVGNVDSNDNITKLRLTSFGVGVRR